MKYHLTDLIDVERLQRLTDLFSDATGMVTAVLDLDGTIITKSGWRDICTKFHRVNAATRLRCLESDTVIANDLEVGKAYTIYKCRNGLVDAAIPVTIDGEHIGNFFTGQFLFEPDLGVFEEQARKFGFDEAGYMKAARAVPVIDKAKLRSFLEYFSEFANMLGEMGYRQLKQREAQEAVRRSDALLGSIVDGTTDAIFIKDLQGRYLFCNRSAAEAIGRRAEDIIGKDDTFCFPPDEAQGIMAADRDLIRLGGPGTTEEVLTTGRGDVTTFLTTKGPLFDSEGRVTGIFGMARDITERKRMEEELRASRAELERRVRERTAEVERQRRLLESIVENVPVFLTFYTADGEILFTNKEFERVAGWSQADMEHVDVMAECYPDPEYRRKVWEYMMDPCEIWRDMRMRTRDGRMLDTRWMNIALADGARIGIGMDVTEQLRIEGHLRQAQKMEAVGTLAGGIAHDFNNMLTVIIGNAELALDDLDEDEEAAGNVEQIMTASRRARDLVRQILAFSRKTDASRYAFNVTPLLKETFKLLRGTLPSTIRMEMRIAGKEDVVVADPGQVQQIVMNLATNAAHAMRESGGLLTVGIDAVAVTEGALSDPDLRAGDYVKVTVRDTGAGISKEIMHRIFEPFFTTKERGRGTGMGLAVVYGIVKSCGGAVTVESTPGIGSTFDVFLPRAVGCNAEQSIRADRACEGVF